MAQYPLVAQSDCSADTRQEACDIAAAALERFPGDLERCTQARRCSMVHCTGRAGIHAAGSPDRLLKHPAHPPCRQ